ncbi:MAG TPA: kelch repeat-containing protein [Thermoanaerobaculia bacterium]|nr:kelch repeat-containing protein [Thermoanaerobaculia bacterium]
MSVLSPKRVIQFVVASLLAVPLLANHPSPRIQAKMAFDESTGTGVLFGGRGGEDPATGLTHGIDETWLWVRDQWIQQFPATRPSKRSAHAMVYDSKRGRVLVFAGRAESTQLRGKVNLLNDLWQWKNGEWQQLDAGNAPPVRQHADLAYDRVRDRVVMFGGYRYAADNRTIEPLYDTWEFDGESWTEVQTSANGPKVDKPLLAYDIQRKETMLVGIDTAFKTLMFRWNPETRSWGSVTADPMPPCVHESTLVYQTHNQTLNLTGGLCTGVNTGDEVWQWDGTAWTKLDARLGNFPASRTNGSAYAYDTVNKRLVRFGGSSNFGLLLESTTYTLRDQDWRFMATPYRPSPRSLMTFRRDPVRGLVLFGGLTEFSTGTTIGYNSDLWRYSSDQGWSRLDDFADPGDCVTPASAFDIDRNVLVVVCGGQDVWEWNGETWKTVTPRPVPDFRRFAAVAYDQNIKKTVMFGGYDNINYRDETWTWDGAVWTRLRPNKKPGNRAQISMWYDTRAKKTILYSGVGRPNIDEHVTRYADMWSFDGTNWTEMTKTAAPGIRFGTQVTVDPRDGKVLLFGGLRATIDEDDNIDQFYANDTWLWDGAAGTWTQIQTENAPFARQNGAFEFDETSGKFVLYGGFAGQLYLSDTWLFDGTNWTPVQEKPQDFRRRAVRQ